MRNAPPKETLCVIPCYNESVNLGRLFTEIRNSGIEQEFDLVFVDDGSLDSTASVIQAEGYTVLRHGVNLGYGMAVKSGFDHALRHGNRYMVIFPGDAQRKAVDALSLVKTIKGSDLDVVVGSKFHIYSEKHGPIRRRIGNIIFSRLAKFGWSSPIEDILSGFKVYRVDAVRPFVHLLPNGYPFDVVFSYYSSIFRLKLAEIPVACRYDRDTTKMRSVLWVSLKMITHLLMHIFIYSRLTDGIRKKNEQSRNVVDRQLTTSQ